MRPGQDALEMAAVTNSITSISNRMTIQSLDWPFLSSIYFQINWLDDNTDGQHLDNFNLVPRESTPANQQYQHSLWRPLA